MWVVGQKSSQSFALERTSCREYLTDFQGRGIFKKNER